MFVPAMVASPSALADPGFADGQPWGIELGLGWGHTPGSPYRRTLEDFGFEKREELRFRHGFRASVAVERRLTRYLSLLLQANSLDRHEFEREAGLGEDDVFRWKTWALGVHARAWLPVDHERFRAYVQAGIGPTISVTRLRTRLNAADEEQTEFRQSQWFYHVTGLLGVEGMLGTHVGAFVNGGYAYARTPENRLGQRNRGGGGLILAGLSGRFGKK